MRPHAALLVGLLVLVALCCVIYLAARLRHLAAQRADAASRATVALAEMTQLTRELRERQHNEPDEGASLTPGERLRRRYPGGKREEGSGTGGHLDGRTV